jgi:hypothetical protein
MSVIESDLGNLDAALTAARNAQSMPSMFPGVDKAARLYEGYLESVIWMQSKDPACMKRANAIFREVFHSGSLPLDAARPMMLSVAMRSGDLLFARQVAESMQTNSLEQLFALARIEHAERDFVKALAIAEKALRLFPGNAELRKMVEQMRDGTFAPLDAAGEIN